MTKSQQNNGDSDDEMSRQRAKVGECRMWIDLLTSPHNLLEHPRSLPIRGDFYTSSAQLKANNDSIFFTS